MVNLVLSGWTLQDLYGPLQPNVDLTTYPQHTLTKSLHVLMESFTHGHIMLQNLHENILHMITTYHEFWNYVLKDLNNWFCRFRIALK
jgi:hypothetical protein